VADEYQTDIVTDVNARDTVVSHLNAGTQYAFYITCFNSAGSSPASNKVTGHTLGNMFTVQCCCYH